MTTESVDKVTTGEEERPADPDKLKVVACRVAGSIDFCYFPSVLSEEQSTELYNSILSSWQGPIRPNRRTNRSIGDEGTNYRIKFGGYGGRPEKIVERYGESWDCVPGLFAIKQLVEKIMGVEFSMCVIQIYPHGRVGIAPHRDLEMNNTPDRIICGLSLGTTRTLCLEKIRSTKKLEIPLENGSLYALCPPTNRLWKHSITKDDSTGYRISLTFRSGSYA